MSAPTTRQQLGQRGERLAKQFLVSQGYVIEEANVRFPVGEIDLIARDGQVLCFVEVRSAASEEWGGPLGSVGPRKQRRLIRAAQWYAQRLQRLPPEMRFDVVAIDWLPEGAPRIELIRGAFDTAKTQNAW